MRRCRSILPLVTALLLPFLSGCGDTPGDEPRQVRYVAETMNIREQPGTRSRVVRKTQPGQVLQLGPADKDGWAVVWSGMADTVGYVYARSSHLARTPSNTADHEKLGPAADSILGRLEERCGQSRQQILALADRGRRLLAAEQNIRVSRARFLRELDRSITQADSACADAAAFVVLAPPT